MSTTSTPVVYQPNSATPTSTSFSLPANSATGLTHTDIIWLSVVVAIVLLTFITVLTILLRYTCTRTQRQKGRAVIDSRNEQRAWSRESVNLTEVERAALHRSTSEEGQASLRSGRTGGNNISGDPYSEGRGLVSGGEHKEVKTPQTPSWPLPPWPLQAIRKSIISKRERYYSTRPEGAVIV